MKNRVRILCILLAGAFVSTFALTACSKEPSGKVTVEESSSAVSVVNEEDEDKGNELSETEATDEKEIEEKEVEEETEEEIAESPKRILECKADNFKNALSYIDKYDEDEPLSVDYRKLVYKPSKVKLPADTEADVQAYKAIKEKTESDDVKSMRLLRSDNNGATIDATVYTNPSTKQIDSIVTCEYGSQGRDITEYYFDKGSLVYTYEYITDIYGTDSLLKDSYPGKRCYFDADRLVMCTANDADVDYKETTYKAADYINGSDMEKGVFDELESGMINRGYSLYEELRDVPSTTLIYGYVGDEFGGMLSNVHMTISSKENEYSEKFDTNGDGYFAVRVPANDADMYGIVCEYGDYTKSTVDDIKITKGMSEYSLGVIYMAEPGANVHEPNTYLLNANYSSPKKLSEGEYCITMTSDPAKGADLKGFLVNLHDKKTSSDAIVTVKPSKDADYKYYVTDQRGGRSGNPMTYEMTSSDALVRVYSKDGLVAAFMTPVGRAGTVWEVFEIKNGEILPLGNMFHEVKTDIFFE